MLKSCKADGYRCSSREIVVLLSFVDETFRLSARREGEHDFLPSRTSIASDLVDDPSNLYVRWSMVCDSLRGKAFLRGFFSPHSCFIFHENDISRVKEKSKCKEFVHRSMIFISLRDDTFLERFT